jgi:hypothetical protein
MKLLPIPEGHKQLDQKAITNLVSVLSMLHQCLNITHFYKTALYDLYTLLNDTWNFQKMQQYPLK